MVEPSANNKPEWRTPAIDHSQGQGMVSFTDVSGYGLGWEGEGHPIYQQMYAGIRRV